MRWLYWIDRGLLILLGASTGLVKLFQMPAEMQLFEVAGFSTAATMAFGVAQLVAALLLIPTATVRWGAALAIPFFLAATGVLFVNGLAPFGMFSLSFPAAAAVLAWHPRPPQ
jgi:hypothetical protein